MTEFSSGFQVCSVVGERRDSEGMEPKSGGGGRNSGFKRENRIKNVRIKIWQKRHTNWGENMV